VSEDVCIFS